MTDDLDLEARLRAAIHAEADDADVPATHDGTPVMPGTPGAAGDGTGTTGGDLYVVGGFPEDPSLAAIRRKVRTIRRRRRALAAAATVAVVVVAVAALPRLGGDDQSDLDTVDGPQHDLTTATTAPAGPEGPEGSATTPAEGPQTTAPTTSTTPTTTGTPTTAPQNADPNVIGDGFLPLWPFATRDDAEAWQQASASGGEQPWHLDAEQTALSFTTGFLGFTDIDQVTSTDIGTDDARVGVGYTNPDGGTSTAAVIHLMRFGEGDGAPWEVVGTRDDTLVLETPDYATTARTPMRVAGFITGVDESLRVQVRQSSSPGALGESAPFAGGGDHARWETTVDFGGASDPAITVVVSTGGHVQDVERFAITGLRSLDG